MQSRKRRKIATMNRLENQAVAHMKIKVQTLKAAMEQEEPRIRKLAYGSASERNPSWQRPIPN